MRDVTSEVQRFRMASLEVWNNYLMPGQGVLDLNAEESFHVIERELLRCLVFRQDAAQADGYRKFGCESLVVQLASDAGEVGVRFGSPDANGNIIWGPLENFDPENKSVFFFFDFFDWFHYGIIKYDLVRAVERGCGRLVLLPQSKCSFLISDGASTRDC